MSEEVLELGEFVHLHCHSEFSSLDGGCQVGDIADRLEELGMKAVGLTDHGVMQGLPDLQDELRDRGMKPILGVETYFTEDRHDKSKDSITWHLTLLAESTEGYQNLCKLSSWAFIEGNKPIIGRARARADWELLERYAKGVICLSGCMASPVMGEILQNGNLSQARANLERFVDIFGKENVYGEIQNVGIITGIPADSEMAQKLGKKPLTRDDIDNFSSPDGTLSKDVQVGQAAVSQTEGNRMLAEMCEELGLDLVATGDVHYLREEDADPHDVMICIGTSQLKRDNPRRFALLPRKYHMRSVDEMREAVKEWPESISNTVKVAERCNAEIVWGKELLPRYPIPDEFQNSREYLHHLCFQGLNERYSEKHPRRQDAIARLESELSVIDNMGFNDYFLITWDLFNEARRRNIPSGPGRGSAAGSIVAYTLAITQLCPLEYDLLFERFLNPDRKSMPDIDMDFAQGYNGGREALIDYASEKYNELAKCETAVSQIVTFSKYKAKGAIKDAARALAEPTEEGKKEALKLGDRLAAMVPDDPKITMSKLMNPSSKEAQGQFSQESKQLRLVKERGGMEAAVISQAEWLEGMVRAYSTHAAAVLIADHDLTDDLPLQKLSKDKPLEVQYSMGPSERIGLLKMDFLGLRNLDIIWDACEKIKHVHGVEIDPYKDIPLDDAATFETFANGDAVGTFQFESEGMRSALREVRPTEFRDLIALVALYRPGPMAHIPHYAARKHGREETQYLNPKLEPIQGETYGITVYQEQSMIIARELAGFTPGEADDLRKAIGKKLRDKMDALKPKFLDGAKKNDVPKDVADAIWADNEAAADYSFNKSHAACYAYLAYITGYLKTHYPHEYMAALISSVMGKKDKPAEYLREAKRMGLRVLPPDVNRSLKDFAVMEREGAEGEYDILFGLTALRGVGSGVVEEIKNEREARGPFKSMYDLIRRMPHLNKTVIQALVKGGALDGMGASRRAMFDEAEESIKRIRDEIKQKEKDFLTTVRAAAETDRKRPTLERRGLDGGAKLAHLAGDEELSDAEIKDAILEALQKEQLRLARAEVRKVIKEAGGDPVTAGIANEDSASDMSEKDLINSQAEQKLFSSEVVKEREELAETLLPVLKQAVQVVRLEEAEVGGLEAALQQEADPALTAPEWDSKEKLNLERVVLGIYVSGHPMDEIKQQWAWTVDKGLGQISDADITEGSTSASQLPHVAGVIVEHRPIKIRTGTMHKLVVEDLTGAQSVTVWPDDAEGKEVLLQVGEIVSLKVRVEEDTFTKQGEAEDEGEEDAEGGKPVQLIAAALYHWDPTRSPRKRPRRELMNYLGLDENEQPPEEIQKILEDAEKRQEEMIDKAKSSGNQQDSTPANNQQDSTPAKRERKKGDPIFIPVTEAQKNNPEWISRLRLTLEEFQEEDGSPVRLKLKSTGEAFLLPYRVRVCDELRESVRTLIRET